MPYTKPSIYSKLYEIETTNKPYPNKNDEELKELFKVDKYLDIGKLILGKVITNYQIV